MWVIYLIVFNEFLYQNKFVIETNTHKIYSILIQKNAKLHI